jgi:NarL family two-component system response regulator LiaR
MPTRVFLVDDQTMVADTLSLRLSTVANLILVGRSSTTNPALAREIAISRPHVIVIDLEPVGAASRELLGAMSSAWPSAQVVVLTGSRDADLAVAAARGGAAAWIAKESSLADLIEVIHGVRAGSAWYPPEHLGVVLRALRADAASRGDAVQMLETLSAREFEVLLGIIDGTPYRAIADAYGISVKTVQSHAVKVFAKLGVHSRSEVARVAAQAGLHPASGGDASHPPRPVRIVHRDESPGQQAP